MMLHLQAAISMKIPSLPVYELAAGVGPAHQALLYPGEEDAGQVSKPVTKPHHRPGPGGMDSENWPITWYYVPAFAVR